MCGRFNDQLTSLQGWEHEFIRWPSYQRRYNRAPTEQIAAFTDKHGRLMRWGLIPKWASEFSSPYATFNARAETLASKPTFRNAWHKYQRCLIPMAGYYEWQKVNSAKQAVYIHNTEEAPLVAAGLYEFWGVDQVSCTMITTASQGKLQSVHHRMPVLVSPKSATAWLHDRCAIDEITSPQISYYNVSNAVGNVKNNSSDLIKRI